LSSAQVEETFVTDDFGKSSALPQLAQLYALLLVAVLRGAFSTALDCPRQQNFEKQTTKIRRSNFLDLAPLALISDQQLDFIREAIEFIGTNLVAADAAADDGTSITDAWALIDQKGEFFKVRCPPPLSNQQSTVGVRGGGGGGGQHAVLMHATTTCCLLALQKRVVLPTVLVHILMVGNNSCSKDDALRKVYGKYETPFQPKTGDDKGSSTSDSDSEEDVGGDRGRGRSSSPADGNDSIGSSPTMSPNGRRTTELGGSGGGARAPAATTRLPIPVDILLGHGARPAPWILPLHCTVLALHHGFCHCMFN
jgi:hypothetical protein